MKRFVLLLPLSFRTRGNGDPLVGSVPSRRGFRLPEPRQGSVRVGRQEGRGRGGGQGRRGEGGRPQGADGRPQDETVRQVRQRHQPRGGGGVVENKTPRFGNTFSCTYIISHIHRQRLLLQYKLLDEVILLRLDLLESLALDPEAFESHLPLHDERVQLLLLLLACLGNRLWTFRTHAQIGLSVRPERTDRLCKRYKIPLDGSVPPAQLSSPSRPPWKPMQ